MNNHKNSILHQTENGSVLKCTCCKNLQVSFGNMVMKLSYDQFLSFMECIDKVNLNKTPNAHLPNEKEYLIRLPNDISFAFTREEMIELKELLEWSQATLKVNNLLETC